MRYELDGEAQLKCLQLKRLQMEINYGSFRWYGSRPEY